MRAVSAMGHCIGSRRETESQPEALRVAQREPSAREAYFARRADGAT